MSDVRSELLVHVVWAVEGREPTLSIDRDAWLHERLAAESAKVRTELVAVGNASDHVHVLVDLNRGVAIATLVQQLKGASSHAWNLRADAPVLRWQAGYFAESIARADRENVAAYVRAQRAHHLERAPDGGFTQEAPVSNRGRGRS